MAKKLMGVYQGEEIYVAPSAAVDGWGYSLTHLWSTGWTSIMVTTRLGKEIQLSPAENGIRGIWDITLHFHTYAWRKKYIWKSRTFYYQLWKEVRPDYWEPVSIFVRASMLEHITISRLLKLTKAEADAFEVMSRISQEII